jgi:hypothetical protein
MTETCPSSTAADGPKAVEALPLVPDGAPLVMRWTKRPLSDTSRCTVPALIPSNFRIARAAETRPPALKLDYSFVADCGTDIVNAPLCKSVIDLLTILAETL